MRPTRSIPMIAMILSFSAPAFAQEPTASPSPMATATPEMTPMPDMTPTPMPEATPTPAPMKAPKAANGMKESGAGPGTVGVGVALGQPVGLTLKLRAGEHESVEFVGGAGLSGEKGFTLAYLYESNDLLGSDLFLNAFFGAGGIYLSVPGQDDPQEYEETEHDHIGVVLPIGIELRLPAVPRLGLNAQILPGYAIVDRPGFVGGAFVGARWWF